MDKNIIDIISQYKISGEPLPEFLKKGLFFLITVIIATLFFPKGKTLQYSELVIGSVVKEEIIAPFTFPILKTNEELEEERNKIVSRVSPVFSYQPQVASNQIKRLRESHTFISAYLDTLKINSPQVLRILKTYNPSEENSIFHIPQLDTLHMHVKERFQIALSRNQLTDLVYLANKKELGTLEKKYVMLLKKYFAKVIVDQDVDSLKLGTVILRRSAENRETTVDNILDIGDAQSRVMVEFREKIGNKSPYVSVGSLLVNTFIVPNWYFDQEYTVQLRREAIASVPTSRGFVYKNERIVDSHQIVTRDIYRKIRSLSVAIQEEGVNTSIWNLIKGEFGRFVLSFLIVMMFASFLFVFRRKTVWNSYTRLLLVNLIMIILITITGIELFVLQWPEYSVPFIMLPMLYIMLLDGGVAFVGAGVAALLIGAINGMDFVFTAINLFAGIGALFAVREVRKRSQIISAGMIAWIIYIIAVIAIGLLRYKDLNEISDTLMIVTINAFITPFIAYGSLGLFEKIFDITTSFTLLELSDMNHPLLKSLSQNASGTFSHSIEVGNLAEAAAKEINADSLLTRVGCYYHDIGKMEKPEYFVENQRNSENKHDNLTPTMSALVIASHVKSGLDLADKYKLPAVIKAFIPEHHGTTPMEYFLHKAKENNPDTEIDESNFRYPGPKPQSKETAIVLLADSIEAASRLLKEPSASRIKALIEEIVLKKMNDGQLDEANLTLREISEIKEAFAFYLMSKFHLRIEYPDSIPEKKNNTDLAKQGDKKDIDKKDIEKENVSAGAKSGAK